MNNIRIRTKCKSENIMPTDCSLAWSTVQRFEEEYPNNPDATYWGRCSYTVVRVTVTKGGLYSVVVGDRYSFKKNPFIYTRGEVGSFYQVELGE